MRSARLDKHVDMNGAPAATHFISETAQKYDDYKKKEEFRAKVYFLRNSLLTDLMALNHLQTVYNISIGIFMLLVVTMIMYYIASPSDFSHDVSVITWGAGKMKWFFIIWTGLHISCVYVMFPTFTLWTTVRSKFNKKIMDTTFLLAYISYLITTIVIPAYILVIKEVPPITAFATLGEQLRLWMKTYSFVRENVPKVLQEHPKRGASADQKDSKGTPHLPVRRNVTSSENGLTPGGSTPNLSLSRGYANAIRSDGSSYAGSLHKRWEEDSSELLDRKISDTTDSRELKELKNIGKEENKLFKPNRGNFIYFLFAPTLVYREYYPIRSEKSIRWGSVLSNFLQFWCSIFIIYCGFTRFSVPMFSKACQKEFLPSELVLIYAGCMFVGSLKMFLVFYGFLHCWFNAFAEILQFGDRQFYQDWWNSTSFSQYYRKWNGVVYDWLYAYIHTDIYKLTGNRVFSMVTVFLISAVFHEYVLTLGFGFFYPVLYVVYTTVGVSVVFLTNKRSSQQWNIFMWFMLFSGWGILEFLYSFEWYARANTPREIDGPLDYFLPRTWTCKIVGEQPT